MKEKIRFVFVLYNPTDAERRRSWDIVIDNTVKNLGYGGGANLGITRALREGAEWVVVCNQDIALSNKDKELCKKKLMDAEPGVYGPEAGSLDKKRWTTILPAIDSPDYISGSCIAIHKKVIEKIGYFYEPYFMYYEDTDFSVRAKIAGFPIRQLVLPDFQHDRTIAKGRRKKYYLFRNHLLFVLLNAPWSVKLHEFLRLPKTLYDYWS